MIVLELAPKERPILFSAPMVRALLAGTKTQTRRIFKIRGPMGNLCQIDCPEEEIVRFDDGSFHYLSTSAMSGPYPCPYGEPRDRLWVREAWRVAACYDDKSGAELEGIITARNVQYSVCADQFLHGMAIGRYRHARFMPRWASRITLEITNVRVERLQEISKKDAEAEGVAPWRDEKIAHVAMYRELWEQINGSGSWDANPFVWVIEFRRAA